MLDVTREFEMLGRGGRGFGMEKFLKVCLKVFESLSKDYFLGSKKCIFW